MKTVLLTGCSGYIARTMLPFLKQKGISVIGLDRRPGQYPVDNLDRFIQCDLHDEARLRLALDGVDSVFHLAAAKADWGLSDKQYFDDNVAATRTLLGIADAR